MKKARLINLASWVALIATLSIFACICWRNEGCAWRGVLVGIAVYSIAGAIGCAMFDQSIKGHFKN